MHVNHLSWSFLILVSVAGISLAQEVEQDAFQSGQSAIVVTSSSSSDGTEMGTTVMALDSSELAGGPMVFATEFSGDAMPFGGAGDSFSMLNNASVQKDLQLVDEQLEQIQDINKDFSEQIREKLDEMRDDGGNFNIQGGGFASLISDLKEKQRQQIENILLPDQQDRLKQVARQMKMKNMGSQRVITEMLSKELGISDEQKTRIKEKSQKLQSELESKIAELKANAKKDLLQELSQDQRQKLEDLLGDEFVVKDEDSNSRFRLPKMRNKKKAGDF